MPIDLSNIADYNPRQIIVKNETSTPLSIGDLKLVLNSKPLPGSTIDLIKLQPFNKKPFRTFTQISNSRDLELCIKLGKVTIETEVGNLSNTQGIRKTDVASLFEDVSAGGALDTFLELLDTPDSYSGSGNLFIKTNNAETDLEFSTYLYENATGVGINTTSPLEKLSVNGNIGLDGALKREDALTDAPLIFIPKGTGAIQVGSSGNTRGDYAIDFQAIRESVSEVASGDYSFIAGGKNNKASGDYSHVEGIMSTSRKNNIIDNFTISGVTITISGDVASKYSNGGSILFFDLTGGDSNLNSAIRTIVSLPTYSVPNTTFDINANLDDDFPGVARDAGSCVSVIGGLASHVEGIDCRANSAGSHSEGIYARCAGNVTHAEGYRTLAGGNHSHVEGLETLAGNPIRSFIVSGPTEITIDGDVSTEFTNSSVVSFYNLSGGSSTLQAAQRIISNVTYNIGPNTTTFDIDFSLDDRTDGFCIDTSVGVAAHAEGNLTIASGDYSHAEGNDTTASGESSHSEGELSIASGLQSHAEGFTSTASGTASHSEGYETEASGIASHAEGGYAIASGPASHAEGIYTIAAGKGSHVEGEWSEATVDAQFSHVEGLAGKATIQNQHIHGNSTELNAGKFQYSRTIFRRPIGDGGSEELTANGSPVLFLGFENRFLIPVDKAIGFTIDIVARKDDGSKNAFLSRRGMIQNTSGTTSIVGAIQTIGTDIDATGLSVSITANDTDDYLVITGTVSPATGEFEWMAVIQGFEVEN